MAITLTPDFDDLNFPDEFGTTNDAAVAWKFPRSLPPGLTSTTRTVGPQIIGVSFTNIGVYQWRMLGQTSPESGLGGEILSTGPDRNLCGSLTFKSQSFTIKDEDEDDGETPDYSSKNFSLTHGIRTVGETKVYDIRRTQGNGNSGTAETGVTIFSTSEASANIKEAVLASGSVFAGEKSIGSITLSSPVTSGWLKTVASEWASLSKEDRRETAFSSTPGAWHSGSEQGYYAGASAVAVSRDLPDLRVDDVIHDDSGAEPPAPPRVVAHRWYGGVKVRLPVETRKNFPVLRDSESGEMVNGDSERVGLGIYNKVTATIQLSVQTSGKRWRDDLGKFNPEENGVLDEVGWGAHVTGGVQGQMEQGVAVEVCEVQALSADGADYRVDFRVEFRNMVRSDGSNTFVPAQTLHTGRAITLQAPLTLPSLAASSIFDQVVFTKVERRPAGALPEVPYVDITESYQRSSSPGPGVHLVVMVKRRWGGLWGFPVNSEEQDETNRAVRYAVKSLRQNSAIEPGSSGVDPLDSSESVSDRDSSSSSSSFNDPAAGGQAPVSPQERPSLPSQPPLGPPTLPALPEISPPIPPESVRPPSPPPLPPAPPVAPDAPPVIEPWTPPVFADNGRPPGGFNDGWT